MPDHTPSDSSLILDMLLQEQDREWLGKQTTEEDNASKPELDMHIMSK